MKIQMLTKRNILFTFQYPDWDLNLHLILGEIHDFLIDTGIGAENIVPILDYRKNLGRKNKLIVINTHYHFDHIWGNYFFKEHTIIAHQQCPKKIEEDWQKAVETYRVFYSDEVEKVLPNLLIRDEIYFEHDRVRIFAAAGHSCDGISVLDEADKVLNVGDNIGDTPEQLLPELECSPEEYFDALQKYRRSDFDILISGHNIPLRKSILDKVEQELKKS